MCVSKEFMDSLIFEENPLEREPAEEVRFYDLAGNEVEVRADEAE